MPDDLLRFREEFPMLEKSVYMISNSLGAMPREVYDALKGYADTWGTRGVRAWEERWWMLAIEVGNELGALMNARKDSVSVHQNVTTCQAVVASCFDFTGKRNKVVYSDKPRPTDDAWNSHLLFELRGLAPLAIGKQVPVYLPPLGQQESAKLQALRPRGVVRYPQPRLLPPRNRVSSVPWKESLRRIDLDAPAPSLPSRLSTARLEFDLTEKQISAGSSLLPNCLQAPA